MIGFSKFRDQARIIQMLDWPEIGGLSGMQILTDSGFGGRGMTSQPSLLPKRKRQLSNTRGSAIATLLAIAYALSGLGTIQHISYLNKTVGTTYQLPRRIQQGRGRRNEMI